MIHTRSAGGIVLGDGGSVAMVRQRNGNGAWLFPKGGIEEDESDEEAARREIEEETGLTNLELLGDLGSYERHPINPDGTDNQEELKEIRMFLFAATSGAPLAPTLEIEEAIWVPFSKVGEVCGNVRDCTWYASVYDRVKEAINRD